MLFQSGVAATTDANRFSLFNLVVAAFGASGWGAAIMKMIIDFRDDRRKDREDARKDAAEARASQEVLVKRALAMAPFITKLNEGDILSKFERIKHLRDNPNASFMFPGERAELSGYPGILEELGAVMLAGGFEPRYVYEHFGAEILTTSQCKPLWEGEDMHYWKVFRLLSEAMERVEKQSHKPNS